MRKFDEPSAFLALMEIMARTPHGSWCGSPHFGLRDYLNLTPNSSEVPKLALDELNRALAELALGKWKIESIVPEQTGASGVAAFIVTVASEAGENQVLRLEPNR